MLTMFTWFVAWLSALYPKEFMAEYGDHFKFHPCKASWYGEPFHGRLTSCGEIYDQNAWSCASNQFPSGTVVEFMTKGKNRFYITVNDLGPFVGDRNIDLSRRAFEVIVGDLDVGVYDDMYYRIVAYAPRPTMRYGTGGYI